MSETLIIPTSGSKAERYQLLLPQIEALIDMNCGWVANYANVCAAIQQYFNHWWCGFYLINNNNQLELGPFIGPVACTIIDFNKGVCGKAWAQSNTIVVPNVHEFKGHIACSSESNSEIVVPILQNNKVIGVLDIDSINFNAFDEIDQNNLENVAKFLAKIPVNF